MLEPLTNAESRVMQTILNLPGPIPVEALMFAATRGQWRGPHVVTTYILQIRRKRPMLSIRNVRGIGYEFVGMAIAGRCTGCGRTHKRQADLCGNCFRVYCKGYNAAMYKMAKKARKAQARSQGLKVSRSQGVGLALVVLPVAGQTGIRVSDEGFGDGSKALAGEAGQAPMAGQGQAI